MTAITSNLNGTSQELWASVEQKEKARKIIKQKTLLATSLSFIPIPILDTFGITSIQICMIQDIAEVYNIPFKPHLVKSFVGSLVSNLGTISLIKFVPFLGVTLGSSVGAFSAATATYALGKVFMQHFNQGGTLLNFDPVKARIYFQKLHDEKSLKKKKQYYFDTSSQDVTILKELKKTNERYLLEEQLHIKLHEESDQIIAELHDMLREQEDWHLIRQQKNNNKIADLEKANTKLALQIVLFQEQLEEIEKKSL